MKKASQLRLVCTSYHPLLMALFPSLKRPTRRPNLNALTLKYGGKFTRRWHGLRNLLVTCYPFIVRGLGESY